MELDGQESESDGDGLDNDAREDRMRVNCDCRLVSAWHIS